MADNETQPDAGRRVTFGEELRKEREIRGIELREIAEATKISQRFLDALERDDFKNLPAPVFSRGFVREYSRYLGLDAEEMVDRYVHFCHSIDDPTLSEFPEPLHSDRVTGEIPNPIQRVDRNVWILILLALICVGAIFGVRYWMQRDAARSAPPASTQSSLTAPATDSSLPPSVFPRYHGAARA
jgi:cytoskeletal protein RodZ